MSKDRKKNPLLELQQQGARPPHESAGKPVSEAEKQRGILAKMRDSQNARSRARMQLLRETAEKERKEALSRTRAALETILKFGESDTPTPENPHARGASDYLARLVTVNPEEALRVSELLRRDSQEYNEWAVEETWKAQEKREEAEELKGRLRAKPISNSVSWGKRSGPPEANGSNGKKVFDTVLDIGLKTAGAAVNVGTRLFLAGINLTPRDALNEIRVDDEGIHMSQPLRPIATTHRKPGKANDLEITIDPVSYLDKVIGFWNALGIFGETAGPIGRVVVLAKGTERQLGSAVVFRPGRFKRRIVEAMETMEPVQSPPLLSPEIKVEDIFQEAARVVKKIADKVGPKQS